jgi:DNA replication protein DnaC
MKKQNPKTLERFNEIHKPDLLNRMRRWNKKSCKIIEQNELPSLDYYPGSAYLFGSVGNGKTTAALWRALEWARWRFLSNNFLIDMEFRTVFELLQSIKYQFTKDISQEIDIIKYYENINLLLIDDLGSISTSNWGYSILLQILNTRESMERTTIFTSNLSLQELSKQLNDDRIPDRIRSMCKDSIYHFTGPSLR